MGNLSQHFSRMEFKCRCGQCKQDAVDHKLVTVLERIRLWAGKPITINSGNRCVEHNETVQKESNPNYVPYSSRSQHLYSKAADIQVKDHSPEEIYDIINEWYPDDYGLKKYSSWIHFDVRNSKWRG